MFQQYSRTEERANTLTHALGAFLSLVAMAILVSLSARIGDPYRIASFSVYGISMFLLYLSSASYHGITRIKLKQTFRLLDHSAIFLLIAGSYTPFTILVLRESIGWYLLAIIWTLALAGIIVTVFYMHKMKNMALVLYVAMSWIAILAVKPLYDAMGIGALSLLIGGGLFYSFGIIFYVIHKIPFNHAIWHLFVLAGSFTHFLCMLLYLL